MKLERCGEWVLWERRDSLEHWFVPSTGAFLAIIGKEFIYSLPSTPDQNMRRTFKTESEAQEFAREIMGGGKDE